MMREGMLVVHFIGLAMGLGTSIGFMVLGIAASKLEKEDNLIVYRNNHRDIGGFGFSLIIT